MYVIRMDCDDQYPGGQPLHIPCPAWNDVEAAIQRLDGLGRTEINLADGDRTGLLITGGAEGRYMCERMLGDRNWLLMDPSKPMEPAVAIMQGGSADFPEAYTVDLEMALKAARRFLATGVLDPSLSWRPPA